MNCVFKKNSFFLFLFTSASSTFLFFFFSAKNKNKGQKKKTTTENFYGSRASVCYQCEKWCYTIIFKTISKPGGKIYILSRN